MKELGVPGSAPKQLQNPKKIVLDDGIYSDVGAEKCIRLIGNAKPGPKSAEDCIDAKRDGFPNGLKDYDGTDGRFKVVHSAHTVSTGEDGVEVKCYTHDFFRTPSQQGDHVLTTKPSGAELVASKIGLMTITPKKKKPSRQSQSPAEKAESLKALKAKMGADEEEAELKGEAWQQFQLEDIKFLLKLIPMSMHTSEETPRNTWIKVGAFLLNQCPNIDDPFELWLDWASGWDLDSLTAAERVNDEGTWSGLEGNYEGFRVRSDPYRVRSDPFTGRLI